MRATPSVCGLLVSLSLAGALRAGVVYDSGGFEPQLFTAASQFEIGLL